MRINRRAPRFNPAPLLTHAFHPYFYLRTVRKITFGSNSNRQVEILERNVTSRKETEGTCSNRH
jgi:hypothetical protein